MINYRLFFVAAMCSVVLPVAVSAQRVPAPSDLYQVGEQIDVQTSTSEDVVVAGGSVRIVERVGQDILAAGGDIQIDAPVGDDIRVAGGTVTINGTVGGDVLLAGGDVHIRKDTVIAGDLHVFGGQVVVDGTVNGKLYVRAGSVQIHGDVRGTADVKAGEARLTGMLRSPAIIVADDFQVTENAIVSGDLRYWRSAGAITNNPLVDDGTLVYDETLAPHVPVNKDAGMESIAAAAMGVFGLFGLLSAALVIALLLLSTKTLFSDSAKHLKAHPYASFFGGLIFVVATPMLSLFMLLTIIGIPLALTLLALYVIVLAFSVALSSVVLARLIEQQMKAKWGVLSLLAVALLTYVIVKLLVIVPVLGWLASMLIVFAGVGALLATLKVRVKKIV